MSEFWYNLYRQWRSVPGPLKVGVALQGLAAGAALIGFTAVLGLGLLAFCRWALSLI